MKVNQRFFPRAYTPHRDSRVKAAVLDDDLIRLVRTIDHNIYHPEALRFRRKVAYDNLPEETIPAFRAFVAQKGQALLEEIDRWLAEHDRDRNPESGGTGRISAGVGIYYFEEDLAGGTNPGTSSHGALS